MWEYDDDSNRPPSASELCRYEADCQGELHPDYEWILTDYDVWMRNPHFKGPRTEGHPNDPEMTPDEQLHDDMRRASRMIMASATAEYRITKAVDDSVNLPWEPGYEDLDDSDIPF